LSGMTPRRKPHEKPLQEETDHSINEEVSELSCRLAGNKPVDQGTRHPDEGKEDRKKDQQSEDVTPHLVSDHDDRQEFLDRREEGPKRDESEEPGHDRAPSRTPHAPS